MTSRRGFMKQSVLAALATPTLFSRLGLPVRLAPTRRWAPEVPSLQNIPVAECDDTPTFRMPEPPAPEPRIEKRVRIVNDFYIESPRDWDNFGHMAGWPRRYTLGEEQPDCTKSEYLNGLAVEVDPEFEDFVWCQKNERYNELHEDFCQRYQGGNTLDLLCEAHQYASEIAEEAIQSRRREILDGHYVIMPFDVLEHGCCCGLRFYENMDVEREDWDGIIYCSIAEARENWMVADDADWETSISWGGRGIEGDCVELREGTKHNLRAELEVYGQYLQGDVWGFIVEQRDLNELEPDDDGEYDEDEGWDEIDSCWGFYGLNTDENGMLDHAGSELAEQFREAAHNPHNPEYMS